MRTKTRPKLKNESAPDEQFETFDKDFFAETPAQVLKPENFPHGLNDLSSPPKMLFFRGMIDPRTLTIPIAIVGTRKPSEYGRNFAHTLARFLAEKGCTIVSGLALGIDAAAHQGALSSTGATVGILGTGIDIIYPAENKGLFEQIAKRGLLLTQFQPGQPPDRSTFPQRNQLIAAMSKALVVIESDTTGGAMITAGIAKKLGRKIFALPGRVDQSTSRGTNKLIQEGATLFTSPEELFYFLNNPTQTELPLAVQSPRKNSRGRKVQTRAFALPPEISLLASGIALSIDELSEASKTPVHQLMGIVLQQEIDGSIVRRLDGKYEAI